MSRDRHYQQALTQVDERVDEATMYLSDALSSMRKRRPREALDYITMAKTAVEGAMVAAKWAATLPEPEDE